MSPDTSTINFTLEPGQRTQYQPFSVSFPVVQAMYLWFGYVALNSFTARTMSGLAFLQPFAAFHATDTA